MNVPVYAEFHRWLGRGDVLGGMWEAWSAGDRQAALKAIPDEAVDDLVVHGSPEVCRARIDEYFANGVTTTSLALMPVAPFDYWEAARAPRAERALRPAERRVTPRPAGAGAQVTAQGDELLGEVAALGRLGGLTFSPLAGGGIEQGASAGDMTEAEAPRGARADGACWRCRAPAEGAGAGCSSCAPS